VNTPPIRTWVRNAAAVFSNVYGAVARQAELVGCSRQTVYQHARQVEQRLEPDAHAHADLIAENQRLRDQLDALGRQPEPKVLCDPDKLRQVATVAFAAGVTTRQIEVVFDALLPPGRGPDHSTIGRWVNDEAKKAKRVLVPLDDACAGRVVNLALDEIFLATGRPSSGSSRRA
jgi:hypothetical protein